MVKFETYALHHVLDIQIAKAREEIERVVPNRSGAYRVDKVDLGQTVKISGEIRASSIDEAYSAIE